MAMRTSTQLTLGATYSREQLRELFGITDATLNTGIFRPAGYDSIWLFITDHKTADPTQYEDRLDGDDLFFEGQTKGRTDQLITEHHERGLELLLFHRSRKDERPDYSFTYKGPFEFVDAQSGPPTKFHLRCVPAGTSGPVALKAVASELEIRENVRRFARDALDARDRTQALVRQTTYWVFDTEDGTFGPSKFVGYQRMTFTRYEAAVAGPTSGAAFDGHAARTTIEKILGDFKPSAVLAGLLKSHLVATVGQDAIRGIDQSKWAFAVVRSPRKYWALVCNPDKFDGLGAVQALDELAWTVDRGDFSLGDRIALWQSKGKGTERGIIAVGEVTRGVVSEACPQPEDTFWRIPGAGERPRIRFGVARGVNLPLWESPAAPWLGDLAAARARGGTVFSLEPEEWHAIAVAAVVDPAQSPTARSSRRTARQGFGLTAVEKRAVERHAQQMAEEHFIALGFEVEDVSATDCYDLRCTNGSSEVRVEVKGTTGLGQAVILTRNEVAHAREQGPRMALAITSGIRLEKREGDVLAKGGNLRVIRPWAIDEGTLDATQFEYRPKP